MRTTIPNDTSANPSRMTLLGRRSPAFPAGEERHREHAERERREGEARLHRAVLEHHLQVDRQGDHRPAQGDLLEHLLGDAQPEDPRSEEVRIEQRRLPPALAVKEPGDQPCHRQQADREQGDHRLSALLPHQDAQHHSAHADHGEARAHGVDAAGPRVGNVLHQLDAEEHDRDHDVLEQERDAPGEIGGDEAAEQRSHGCGDRGRRPDEGVGLPLRRPPEVAVDEGLHGRKQERRAEAAHDRPEHQDRPQALGEDHRQGADGVAEQPQHVGPLAPDEVADLAADQDEGGRHQRLDGDGRLDAAHGRVEVPDHRRDRDVHQRRVDDEHEHRHRQEEREPLAAGSLDRDARRGLPAHSRPIASAISPTLRCHPAGRQATGGALPPRSPARSSG
jgi:hypothetical protein